MKIQFLGTAAAEGVPAPFCTCDTCDRARRIGTRDVRMRTALLVNDDLLLDCGPDIVAATQRLGISLSRLTSLLVGHAHEDHWYPANVLFRHPGFCPTPLGTLHVYGPGPVTRSLRTTGRWGSLIAGSRITVNTVRAGQRWRSGQYQITALPARHAGTEAALLYSVSDGTRKLLYAMDTGPLLERAWRIIAREAPFDAVVMDETMGGAQYGEHQSMESFLADQLRFSREGWLAEGAWFVACHFSHQSNPPHGQLVEHFAPHRVLVAYDGLRLDLDNRNLRADLGALEAWPDIRSA